MQYEEYKANGFKVKKLGDYPLELMDDPTLFDGILTQDEKVQIDRIYGHGGFFKNPEVGQTMLSAAIGIPVSVMETAGEGGLWYSFSCGIYALEGFG